MAAAVAMEECSERVDLGSLSMSGGVFSADANSSLDARRTHSDEPTIKVRKPYTISKPRERWTDEEHEKFIEALKLHGRNWRRIQEHIGTKTAIQIRSHAQKFFSKVEREPCMPKLIDIPPPRPKRKPLHPYPRKCRDSMATSTWEQSKFAPSHTSSASARENGSPVSVLSGAHGDPFGASVSSPSNICTSPNSSDGRNRTSASYADRDNGIHSCATSDEENMQSDSIRPEQDEDYDDQVMCADDTAEETSLKLFGKTVRIPDSKKAILATSRSSEINTDRSSQQGVCSEDYTLPDGASAMYNYFPINFLGLPQASLISSLAWWYSFYGSLAQHAAVNPNCLATETSYVSPTEEAIEASGENYLQENGAADAGTASSHQYSEIVDRLGRSTFEEQQTGCDLKPSKNSAFVRVKRTADLQSLGFIPYKRKGEQRGQ